MNSDQIALSSPFVVFYNAVLGLILQEQDQKHGRKDTGNHVRHRCSNMAFGLKK